MKKRRKKLTQHLDRRDAPQSQTKRELSKESHRLERGQSRKTEPN
jgi:hypothetical protein